MDKKLGKIIGLRKSEFDQFINHEEREARLIPTYKLGDEMALTSVLLATIKLVKEFRNMILKELNMPRGGKVYVYTEVDLDPNTKEKKGRPDGLLIVVAGGIIKDAAIFEMKNGNDKINKDQIERYQGIATSHAIPRLVTVSNQFVSESTQCPIDIKSVKGVDMYHFSWTYLLTIAHVLLFDNDTNITDEDQIEIMREAVKYLEHEKSGAFGFHQMQAGWKDVIEKIISGASLRDTDKDVYESVRSWQQEEKDMALILSQKLGVLVESGERKYRGKLQDRVDNDINSLINYQRLESVLKVRDAVSDIRITGNLDKRSVEMCVSLMAPQDSGITTKGQIGWLKRQLMHCQKKDEKTFKRIEKEIWIDTIIKNIGKTARVNVGDLDSIYETLKGKSIKEYKVVLLRDFGRKFANPKKFVDIIEKMLEEFYSGIVEHLSKWTPSAPKLVKPATEEEESSEQPTSVTALTNSHPAEAIVETVGSQTEEQSITTGDEPESSDIEADKHKH